jgi:hypothetical protein
MRNICTCGHARSSHEHYRPGSDCSLCTAGACVRYRSDTILNRLFDRVRDGRKTNPATAKGTARRDGGRKVA